ncbi:MAG: Response regulator [Nitrospirae bacterium]|nr:Response regulator [Nitrospirota bacterium]
MGNTMIMSRGFGGLHTYHSLISRLLTHMKAKPVFKRKLILTVVVLSIFVLGFMDYATGHELGFFVFYFLPIAIAAWKTSPITAYIVSILSATVCFLSAIYSSQPGSSGLITVWNGALWLICYLIIAYCTLRIRVLRAREAEASHDHLKEGKPSREWIPICASCRKIRDDKGRWEEFEDYLGENADAQLTHGLCQECIDKLLREAGIENSLPIDKTLRRGPPLDSKEEEGK